MVKRILHTDDTVVTYHFAVRPTCAGYYADTETRCQVFHVCTSIPNADPIKASFLCPNGTLFNQEAFVCQWYQFNLFIIT